MQQILVAFQPVSGRSWSCQVFGSGSTLVTTGSVAGLGWAVTSTSCDDDDDDDLI